MLKRIRPAAETVTGRVILSIAVLLLTVGVQEAHSAIGGRGGTNYIWYNQTSGNWEPYGVIYNYDVATATIDSQLQWMYNNGQRRLRLPIIFGHGVNTGTVMDSTGGNLAPRYRTNLTNLLAKIRQIGFWEIEVTFSQEGPSKVPNNMTNWSTWNETLYQETWNVIVNLHPIIAACGMTYQIDLGNEAVPSQYWTNYAVSLDYTRRLWADYNVVFGKFDTLGFSISPSTDHLQELPNIYVNNRFGNYGWPYLFDVHIYEDSYNTFLTAYQYIHNSYGQFGGWIIGEAFYDSPTEAGNLQAAIGNTTQTVFYLLQWPTTENITDALPPWDFSQYEAYGF